MTEKQLDELFPEITIEYESTRTKKMLGGLP
jgi:hypothetical protein